MTPDKVTLSQLESFLMGAADILRANDFVHLADQPKLLEDQTSYGETLYVPVRARWNEAWPDEDGATVPTQNHLKSALMQDLLTGKVRVTPLLQAAEEASA